MRQASDEPARLLDEYLAQGELTPPPSAHDAYLNLQPSSSPYLPYYSYEPASDRQLSTGLGIMFTPPGSEHSFPSSPVQFTEPPLRQFDTRSLVGDVDLNSKPCASSLQLDSVDEFGRLVVDPEVFFGDVSQDDNTTFDDSELE